MPQCARGNARVTAREAAELRVMRIALRTDSVAGMFMLGLGLLGTAIVVLIYRTNTSDVLDGLGFGSALFGRFPRLDEGRHLHGPPTQADT